MPARCTVCSHKDRKRIDAMIVEGVSNRAIARQFGLSKDAVSRHASAHLAEVVREHATTEALDVMRQLKRMNDSALAILSKAEKRDPELALRAMDRVHKQLELTAKLLGDIDESTKVNVLVSAEWVEIRTAVVGALDPFPQAREAVLRALGELRGG